MDPITPKAKELGGWLSGSAIEDAVRTGEILIAPFRSSALNPNSYNYTLGRNILRLLSAEIDLLGEEEYEELTITDDGLMLFPGECYLAHTAEQFGSSVYASLVTGRSSVGRKFVTNHITAGLIDVGFFGQITLEVTVQRPTRVYAGVPFGQIYWFSIYGDISPQYAGKYQAQAGPTKSRLRRELHTHVAISTTPGLGVVASEEEALTEDHSDG
jgi:dCTP deaminase